MKKINNLGFIHIKMLKKLLYILFFICVTAAAQPAQQAVQAVVDTVESDEEETPWEDLQDSTPIQNLRQFKDNYTQKYQDKDFKYKEEPLEGYDDQKSEEEKDEDQKKDADKKPEKEDIDTSSRSTWDFMDMGDLKWLGWIIATIVLLAIIGVTYYTLSNQGFRTVPVSDRDLKEIEELSEDELIENATLSEMDILLKRAEENQNYRLALRMQFLKIFKTLDDKKLIDYKKNKTNYDYYLELQQKELKQCFRNISRWYDYVWYGEYALDITKYKKAVTHFEETKTYLK